MNEKQILTADLSEAANHIAEILKHEASGVRDGNGCWIGSDAFGHALSELIPQLSELAEKYQSVEGKLNSERREQEIREKLASKPLRLFTQHDAWYWPGVKGDCFMVPDEDGDMVCSGESWEPFSSLGEHLPVRVFVVPDCPPDRAARLLRKIADGIQRFGVGWGRDESCIPF